MLFKEAEKMGLTPPEITLQPVSKLLIVRSSAIQETVLTDHSGTLAIAPISK